jgi:AMP nucleosidase
MSDNGLTPDEAVDRLETMHGAATAALRAALERCLAGGAPPDGVERARFRYPALRVTYAPRSAERRVTRRAWAKFQAPGVYQTTVTQPDFFRPYLLQQLEPLAREFGAVIEVLPGTQEIPFPYVLDRADAFDNNSAAAARLAQFFPTPSLTEIGDEAADGLWEAPPGTPLPLALFDGARVDYSLRRLVHYTGTDWRAVQPWILLTNYHRYVDQFLRWGLAELAKPDTPWTKLVLPGGVEIGRDGLLEADARIAGTQWHRFQMPAYHLLRGDGDGVTLINIGVGPSNAKNITDHLAVLRPNCWLMVGHCAGLRQSQTIGDYVLAHGYLRRDRILDDIVPPEVPVPALAEIQVALQEAAARVTGERGEALKRRLRTGTVVTYDDRNWELRWSRERRRINLSRAIAVDMESGTLAAQGYRFRVPYGTLLCVSDRPLHGEIKLPGTATAFYERAVQQHLMIGLAALEILRGDLGALHSRKLRSFDEPPFR